MREITDIKEKQAVLNEALHYLKRICEKKNLVYWLSNGSLLGAVKYGGFIPWDDDVDIMMPYHDYQILVNSSIDTDRYRLICREKCPGWKYPYAKLSDSSTVVKEGHFNLGEEVGLSVDIFPVEPWCGNRKKAQRQAKLCGVLCRFLYTSTAEKFDTKKTGVKKLILYLIYVFSKLCGSDIFRKMIEAQAVKGTNKNFTEWIGSIRWAPYGVREVLSENWIQPLRLHKFEDEYYPVPHDFDAYLKNLYGDYMAAYPPEKQVSNHRMSVWKK